MAARWKGGRGSWFFSVHISENCYNALSSMVIALWLSWFVFYSSFCSKKSGSSQTSTGSSFAGLISGLIWLWRTSVGWRRRPRDSWMRSVAKQGRCGLCEELLLSSTAERKGCCMWIVLLLFRSCCVCFEWLAMNPSCWHLLLIIMEFSFCLLLSQ